MNRLRFVRLEVGTLGTNCYVLWEDGAPAASGASGAGAGAAVVDPGGDGGCIVQALERAGRPLDYVLLTHGHADHIAALPELLERWPDAQIVIGEGDREMPGDAEANLSSWVGPSFAVTPRKLVPVVGGETVAGRLELAVIPTPGHTPGGICYCHGLRTSPAPVLFCGDTLFAGSVGRCDLPGGSWETLAASLRLLVASLPGDTLVCPGHGPETVLRVEVGGNPYVAEALRGTN